MEVAAAVERALHGFGLRGDPRGGGLLIAVSGGVDSIALLHATLQVADAVRLQISVGHVDHGLRGDESDADAAFVARLAATLGVPAFAKRIDPSALRTGQSSRSRPTLQEAARSGRYRALYDIAEQAGCAHIATAHTLDDQAETVLLRMLRGTGPDGLTGIPARSADGVVVRPLLAVRRAEIVEYAKTRGLVWREDSSNSSAAYARNRLRLRWLPGLAAEFNPQLLRAIANLAEAQKRDSEWIGSMVEQQAQTRFVEEQGWMRILGDDWAALPDALAGRLLLHALRRCGGGRDASRVHIGRMLGFVRRGVKGTHIELPGGVRLERDSAGVRIGPLADPAGTDRPPVGAP